MTPVLMLVLSVAAVRSAATAPTKAPDLSNERLCPATLVMATVRDVNVSRREATAHLKVSHVYCGPSSAQGATFVVSGPADGQSNNFSPSMMPPYRPGESQIWMIRESPKQPEVWIADPVIPHRIGRGLGLPARDSVAATHFPEMREWAEAVEKTVRAPEGDRRSLLEGFAQSSDPPLKQWAHDMLSPPRPRRPSTNPSTRGSDVEREH